LSSRKTRKRKNTDLLIFEGNPLLDITIRRKTVVGELIVFQQEKRLKLLRG